LRRALKTAKATSLRDHLEMNTYGGRLDTAADIVNALNQNENSHIYQHKRWPAGALITIAN
jgi:membrane-bound ClpP family serine protease